MYQFTSNAVSYGTPPVTHAFTGVIRDDGRWVPCCAVGYIDPASGINYGQMWQDFLTWDAAPNNNPNPYEPPALGGFTIVLQPGEVAVGSMLDSLPGVSHVGQLTSPPELTPPPSGPAQPPGPTSSPPPPRPGPPPSAPPPPSPDDDHSSSRTTTRSTHTSRS